MTPTQSPTNPHAAGKAAHTAGPWKASGFTIYATPEKRSFGGPEREYLRPVCSMEPGETDGPEYLDRSSGAEYNERLPGDAEAHANAAFIVRACNSHEALLAFAKTFALWDSKGIIKTLAPYEGNEGGLRELARAAIARATGQGGGE